MEGQTITMRQSGARGQKPTDPANDARQHGERQKFGCPADCQPDQPLKESPCRRPPTRDAGRGGKRTNFPAHDRRGNGQLPRKLSGNCWHSNRQRFRPLARPLTRRLPQLLARS